MQMLAFDEKTGQFLLDDTGIGDYIEVCEVQKTRSKRICGEPCYFFRMLLTFSCNHEGSHYVDFFTFEKPLANRLLAIGKSLECVCLRSDNKKVKVKQCLV